MALPTGSKMQAPFNSQRIDLTLPKHWNGCNREQLELIADVLREQVERQDRYHPFDMKNVKIAVFFLLANLEILALPDTSKPLDEQFYLCRVVTPADKKKHRKSDYRKVKSKGKGKDKSKGKGKGDGIYAGIPDNAFPLYLWQINYWLSPKAKTDNKQSAEYIGQGADILGWLDNKNGTFLTWFPYEEIKRKRYGAGFFARKKAFKGPRTDLDGFSWAQYRFASDMMGTYTQLSNSLIKMQQMKKFTPEQMEKQAKNVELAKSMFLAIIFNGEIEYVDTNTGLVRKGFHYDRTQCTDNTDYFKGFPETQWQVILFWWTGTMHALSKRFPHVFKVQPLNKQKPSTPLEIYTATTATMQKYAGLTEDQVNNQSYSLVLEHLERLSKENEEMEKLRKK